MKGKISLKEFIKEVKEDLQSAIDEKAPLFYMSEVELEVSFVLDAEASAGAKLIVMDIGGKTKATQSHKVKIKLIPFKENKKPLVESDVNIDSARAVQQAIAIEMARQQATHFPRTMLDIQQSGYSPNRSSFIPPIGSLTAVKLPSSEETEAAICIKTDNDIYKS